MIWGAHKADGRIAAKNAIKIRAALGQQLDPNKVYARYQETQPIATDNLAQDRSRARSWAMLNVGLDMNALYLALVRLWAESFVMGDLAAKEAILRAREAKKADDGEYIDWDNWKPGDEVTAALARPPAALQRLLDQAGNYIKGFEKETYNELGTALADSIALGLSGSQSAKLISSIVRSPARALSIAITETNRVSSYSAMQTYKEYGLEKQEWQASSPCDKCAINEGAVVAIGSPFPSGVIQPPQHPHCRCALIPVIPDMSEQPNSNGVVDIAPQSDVVGEFARTTDSGRKSYEYMLRDAEHTDDFKYAAQEWQGDGYRRVQGALSGGSPSDEIKDLISVFDENMVSLEDASELYRGQTEGLTDLKIGDKFKSKLFQATTTDPITAAGFSKSSGSVVGGIRQGETATILRIDAAGAKGVVIPSSSEYEVVLARGTTFEVEDITEETINGVKMRIIDVFATKK